MSIQIQFLMLVSRQGKVRLTKWYSALPQKDKNRIVREVTSEVLARPQKLCNFIEWKDSKVVYKRYIIYIGFIIVKIIKLCVLKIQKIFILHALSAVFSHMLS